MCESRSGASDPILWRAVCDQAAAPIAVLDLTGRYLYVNGALCELVGHDPGELVGRDAQHFVHPEDPTFADMIRDMFEARSGQVSRVFRGVRSDGRIVWELMSGSIVRDTSGNARYIVTQGQDITARRESEIRWQRTFAHAPIGMAVLDLRGHWTEVNAALCELLGYHRDELLNTHFTELSYPDDAESGAFAELLEGRTDTASEERRYRHKDGYPVWLLVRFSAVPGADGRPLYLIGQFQDIGDRYMTDDHVAHLALYDPLTGLANRILLAERTEHELAELARVSDGAVAILLVDIDEFKQVNDRYGHSIGDRILMATADRLLSCTRAGDTVARIGGDEFVVISRLTGAAQAESLRERIEQCLNIQVTTEAGRVNARASVGLAIGKAPTATGAHLRHIADQDMYERKRRRREQPF